MIDQLIIGDKASFDDFGASLAKSKKKPPKKKSIKETVPFSNVTYDFTRIDGEAYWEEGELEYIFEMTADTPEKLEEMKSAFAGWVMNVFEEEIHDPFIPDYHFKGTYEDMTFDDEEGMEKTTATVKFSAYPYKIANYPQIYEVSFTNQQAKSFRMLNNSHHRIVPTVTVEHSAGGDNASVGIAVNGDWVYFEAGTTKDSNLKIPAGATFLSVYSGGTDTNPRKVTITFREEIF